MFVSSKAFMCFLDIPLVLHLMSIISIYFILKHIKQTTLDNCTSSINVSNVFG